MTKSARFTIPENLLPMVAQMVADQGLIPAGYRLSPNVTLQFEPFERLSLNRPSGEAATDAQRLQLLPNGVPYGVYSALVNSLGLASDEKLGLDSVIVQDLGAESIDWLDIIFRLERWYGLEIPRRDIFPEDILYSPQYCYSSGRINADGMAALRQRMPYADLASFATSPFPGRFEETVHTVDFLKKYLEFRGVKFA